MYSKDNEWTKEETDYLFKIVGEYDSRWYVIHDRYDYPEGVARTLEVRLVRGMTISKSDRLLYPGHERSIL